MEPLTYFQAVILGIVEGLTEFLPVSSTGHLTIATKLLGLQVDDPGVTAYTAVIQIGAIIATFLYFGRKIARLFMAWVRGIADADARSIPVGIVGFLGKDLISGALRSLWVVAVALILWSAVIWWAEGRHDRLVAQGAERSEGDVTLKDGIIIGLVQCFSLIPGVSRSGATISAGIARGLNRVTATELSFFMAIPALTAAGIFEAIAEKDHILELGVPQMAVGIVVAFIVAYASIAWLLRFVQSNSLRAFVSYRVVLGAAIIVALSAGWLSAT